MKRERDFGYLVKLFRAMLNLSSFEIYNSMQNNTLKFILLNFFS